MFMPAVDALAAEEKARTRVRKRENYVTKVEREKRSVVQARVAARRTLDRRHEREEVAFKAWLAEGSPRAKQYARRTAEILLARRLMLRSEASDDRTPLLTNLRKAHEHRPDIIVKPPTKHSVRRLTECLAFLASEAGPWSATGEPEAGEGGDFFSPAAK